MLFRWYRWSRKAFHSENGKVISKIAIPFDEEIGEEDAPTVLHALSPQALLLGTDSGKLYLHDLQQQDIRKGIISTSEDQEAELTSTIYIQGLRRGGTSVGEKVLVGQGDGVISLWERGVWGDQDERLVVDRIQSGIESIVKKPLGFGKGKLKINEKIVAAGLKDGAIKFLRIGRNGVLNDWGVRHDDVESVVGLDFDVVGRLVSGGGQVVKVWTEAKGVPGGGRQSSKRAMASDDSDQEEADDSSDEEDDKGKRKKRKRNKGKDKYGGQALYFSGMF